MNTRSHLQPSVVTDKNGKLTTVYRKPASSGSSRSIPSPSAPSGQVDALREKLIKDLSAKLEEEVYFRSEKDIPDLTKRLSKCKDLDYLKAIEKLSEEIQTQSDHGNNFRSMITAIRHTARPKEIEFAANNIELIRAGRQFNAIISAHVILTKRGFIEKGDTSHKENLWAHVTFISELTHIGNNKNNAPFIYGKFPNIIKFVDERPDEVYDLMGYFGTKDNVQFSEEDFDNYKKTHPAMRGGFL